MHIKSLNTFATRHALSVSIVVFIAAIINIYFSFSQTCWIGLVAFLVCQTTRSAPLRQGIAFFFTIVVAMLGASLLDYIIHSQIIFYFILGSLFALCGYLSINRILINQNMYLSVFLFVWLIAGLSPTNTFLMMQNTVLDMMIGAAIGILGAQLIFPVKFYEEFRQGIIPILQNLIDYSTLLSTYFQKHDNNNLDKLFVKKRVMQSNLQAQGLYPEWVFEPGFNPGLRSGYRFFLIHLEQITEIYSSIHYFASREIDIQLLNRLSNHFSTAMNKNVELLDFLLQYFKDGKIEDTTSSDFTTDIVQLEKILQETIPASLELLDLSPDYVAFVALVSDIKDLRALLLQLITALPS